MEFMRKILYIVLLLISTSLHAQQRVMVSASTQTRLLTFRVQWIEREVVDSTVVSIFSSADSITPIYKARGTSPDTIRITVPNDTLTYNFVLRSYRGIQPSNPAGALFHFDANIYYRLVALVIKPDSVNLQPGATQQFCAFMKFSDSTIAIRDRDKSIPECVTFFSQFPDSLKANSGARQRKANAVCLQWQATGGTIDQEICP
jgi:hypothetical protein